MQMVVTGWSDSAAAHHASVKTLARLDSVHTLVALPRYDLFRDAVRELATSNDGVRISEIAGNSTILMTGVAPAAWRYSDVAGRVLYEVPLPADPSRKRVVMRVPVGELLSVLRRVSTGLVVDHVYDY